MAVIEWGKTRVELTTEVSNVNHAEAAGFTGVRKGSVKLRWLIPKFSNATKTTHVSQLVPLTEGSERTLCESGRLFQGRSQAVRIASTLVHLPRKVARMDRSRLLR